MLRLHAVLQQPRSLRDRLRVSASPPKLHSCGQPERRNETSQCATILRIAQEHPFSVQPWLRDRPSVVVLHLSIHFHPIPGVLDGAIRRPSIRGRMKRWESPIPPSSPQSKPRSFCASPSVP